MATTVVKRSVIQSIKISVEGSMYTMDSYPTPANAGKDTILRYVDHRILQTALNPILTDKATARGLTPVGPRP
jgi:hypothetical protein